MTEALLVAYCDGCGYRTAAAVVSDEGDDYVAGDYSTDYPTAPSHQGHSYRTVGESEEWGPDSTTQQDHGHSFGYSSGTLAPSHHDLSIAEGGHGLVFLEPPFILSALLVLVAVGFSLVNLVKKPLAVRTRKPPFAWPPPPIPERASAAKCRPPAPTDRMAELVARRHAVVLELERLEAARLEAERLVVEHNEAIVGCSTMDRAVLASEGPSDPDLAALATRLELEEFDEMLARPVRLRVAAASLPLVEPDDEQAQSSRAVLCG